MRVPPRLGGGLVTLITVVALVLPAPVAASEPDDPRPVRVALLGDSMTHGTAGDYTWRYFAWRQLVAAGVDADFVGPENDLWQNNLDYADGDFDRDHAARYGDAYAWLAHPITQLMTNQHPDVLVILMGLNDLTFARLTPQQVLVQTHDAVTAARAVNPSVKLVLSRLPTTWIAGVTEFNDLLTQAAPTWSTSASPVAVAASDAGFQESTSGHVEDTIDEVHPNAVGQQKIAAAVTDALARLGIGRPYPRPLASVPLGPRTPAVLAAVPGDTSVDLTWSNPPGATTERIWVRDLTAGSSELLATEAKGSAARIEGLENGHSYDISLQSVKGLVPAEGLRSNVVRVRPVGAVPAQVAGILARPADHGVTVSWSATPGAVSYVLWTRNASARTGWSAIHTSARGLALPRLEAGAHYEFKVQAVSTGGAGSFSTTVVAVPRGPKVAAVRWVSARAARSGVVSLRWRPSRQATQYVVFRRDLTRRLAWQRIATGRPLTTTSFQLGGHRRGVRYAFAVQALHQRVVGGRSVPARVRVPR